MHFLSNPYRLLHPYIYTKNMFEFQNVYCINEKQLLLQCLCILSNETVGSNRLGSAACSKLWEPYPPSHAVAEKALPHLNVQLHGHLVCTTNVMESEVRLPDNSLITDGNEFNSLASSIGCATPLSYLQYRHQVTYLLTFF